MITTTINQISTGDQIIASLQIGGVTLASVARSGFACTDEVVSTLRKLAGGIAGLAKLNIRNKTQGWNKFQALALRP